MVTAVPRAASWAMATTVVDELPPLAWLARIDGDGRKVEVTCGRSVRRSATGIFDGTWAGPSELTDIGSATTVFGSGMLVDANGPLVITPSHSGGGVFSYRDGGRLLVANSFAGLVAALGAELDPGADYPGRFVRLMDGIDQSPIELPTSAGPIHFHFVWNLRLGTDGALANVAKPEEAPFTSYRDYRERLSAALGSALANAAGYEPVVSLSSGYDSTAVAVLAAEHGCRQAFTLAVARPTPRAGASSDSGERTARRLGMEVALFDRLDYRRRSDHPEAEFLATGMSGEDVVMSAYDPLVRHRTLLTGTQGNGVWKRAGRRRSDASRSALDGGSLNEFRLRLDVVVVPLPTFGITSRPSIIDISSSSEMRRWSVGGRYDQPISRRIAEEAGIPRGSFAVRKHATSALMHSDGASALSPATLAAVASFAAAERRPAAFPTPRAMPLWQRAVLRLAPTVRLQSRTAALNERRRRRVHFEAEIGTLLLRWAVSVIRPRYRAFSE